MSLFFSLIKGCFAVFFAPAFDFELKFSHLPVVENVDRHGDVFVAVDSFQFVVGSVFIHIVDWASLARNFAYSIFEIWLVYAAFITKPDIPLGVNARVITFY